VPKLSKLPCPAADFVLEDHGSLALLRPLTESARAWVEEKVSQDGFQPNWPTVLIELRHVADILHGIAEAGLAVRA
jgi:hypothetical protein